MGICDGNMQEGSLRCDANVSVRPKGQAEFGTRREIKNLNSFRFIEQAINFEVQLADRTDRGRRARFSRPPCCSTRTAAKPAAMRSKEDAHDYRYFPDPDLLPLVIGADWIERVQRRLPELPEQMNANAS